MCGDASASVICFLFQVSPRAGVVEAGGAAFEGNAGRGPPADRCSGACRWSAEGAVGLHTEKSLCLFEILLRLDESCLCYNLRERLKKIGCPF